MDAANKIKALKREAWEACARIGDWRLFDDSDPDIQMFGALSMIEMHP